MFAVAMTFVNIVPLMTHQSDVSASASITVGNVSPTMFCAGSNLSVPYTANSGFTTGNVFTAQLSNATGSFGSPVNIGSVTSTTSGTISTTIPLGTGAGTGYLIRIVSTSPSVTSINTSNTLIIYAVPSATISSQINVTCHGFNNGSAVVAPGGGISPYSYLWMPGVETSAGILGLAPNNYVVTVTDSNGCTATTSATITQPAVLSASIPSGNITNVSCHGLTNGSAFVTVSGGTTPYSYFWYPSSQTVDTATGLAPGSYNVTVTDANGCTAIATSPSITQPSAALSVNIPPPNITNIPCYNGSTGSILANVSGGTPGYSYTWFPSSETTNPAINLMAGTYYVTVTDANGCTAVGGSATLHDLDTTALTATLWDTVIYSVGIAIVLPSGGSHPYTYLWSPTGATTQTIVSSEFGGNSVTVTDSNGCSYTITQPINLPDTEAIGGTCVFFPNLGQIKDTRDTVRMDIKYYTAFSSPGNFFKQDTICYKFVSNPDTIYHTDTLQRIDLSFNKGNTSNPIAINKLDSGGYLNYYLPQCPSGITDVYAYQYVLYPEVYDHVEALFTGNKDGLKYYIIAMPGADTSQIELQYTGADSVTILVDGEQEIYSPLGSIRLSPPEVYQMDSSGVRVNLMWSANYYSPSSGKIRFHLGSYDTNLPLIMEVRMKHITNTVYTTCQQNFCWSTYFGGNGLDDNECVTTDNSGNAYMGGYTTSTGTTFPLQYPIQTQNYNQNCYIAKFNNRGVITPGWPYNVQWCTLYGGSGDDELWSMSALNSTQDLFAVGETTSTDAFLLHSSGGNFNQSSAGGGDAFILELSTIGHCEWFSFIGGSGYDGAEGVIVSQDATNNPYLYVVGVTTSAGGSATGHFPLQNSPNISYTPYNQTQNNGSSNGTSFIMKFDYSNTNNLVWSSLFGGNEETNFFCVTLRDNYVVVGGATTSTNPDVPSSVGVQTAANANSGSGNLQLCKPNTSAYYYTSLNQGNGGSNEDMILLAFDFFDQLNWCTYFGGSGDDYVYHNDIVTNGREIYIMGNTLSTDLPLYPTTTTSYYMQTTNPTTGMIHLIAKFGNLFDQDWTTYYGWPPSSNVECGITLDQNTYTLYVGSDVACTATASTCLSPTSSDFPLCNSLTNSYTSAIGNPVNSDSYIAAFNSSNVMIWSTYMGAVQFDMSCLSYDNQYNFLYFIGNGGQTGGVSFPQVEDAPDNLYWQGANENGPVNAQIGRFNMNGATGIKEIKTNSLKGKLFVYPNPSSDIVNINFEFPKFNTKENVSLKIYNIMGTEVYSKSIDVTTMLQTTINMDFLPDGIYMIEFVTNENVYNQKVIKNQ